ncbi:stage VI sporulation protein F [Gorillibacterium massiliense]|uniref:stage VI sporulation protein F n=1 Tax=Gorillibacterium massiliense TaxID=1280390 RepID=UPI0004B5522D|nr:stage VI sporulation protein F [Gorillibacterium massiliense]
MREKNDKDVSKGVFKLVKNKTGKSVTAKDIHKIAQGVTPETVQSEAQLRQLIQQVSSLVGVPVAEDTVKEIVTAVQSSKMNLGSLETLMKFIGGGNK